MEELLDFPLIPLRALVAFPRMLMSFSVDRPKSLAALQAASEGEGQIFLATQRDTLVQEPGSEDLFPVGTLVKVKQVFTLPGGLTHVVAEGLWRGELDELKNSGEYLTAQVLPLDREEEPDAVPYDQARIRLGIERFEEYQALRPKQNGVETIVRSISPTKPGQAADVIAAGMELTIEQRQQVLETFPADKRFDLVEDLLEKELLVLRLRKEIKDKTKEQMDKAQREYYLREQMKVMQEELGNGEGPDAECAAFRESIAQKGLPETVARALEKEVDRLGRMQSTSPEANTVRTYLENALALPWTEATPENFRLERAGEILDADHYGMRAVKDRILEHLAVRETAPDSKTPILCLVGPPGVGKTSVARSVARCLGRKYVRMSLGGVKDEAEIRGHRRTYVGAMPGRILAAMRQAGTVNPLLLLDEVDKLSASYNGDPASALLEVLDGEQNFAFRDHYLELPYDLSRVLFLCTANSLDKIPGPLRDRMEILEVPGYTSREKREIALRHLMPKQLQAHGLNKNQLRFTEKGIDVMISGYTREAGVRQLERCIQSVCRKTVKARLEGGTKRVTLSEKNAEDYLGRAKYLFDPVAQKPLVGVARGLAWTEAGGDTLSIEAAAMSGNGKLTLTGNLGKVMEESARAALTYVRATADRLRVDEKFYENTDIHIHVPEGAVPKDGPSAGITMATALVSALTGAPVDNLVAMTGEVTLHGRVLPIGGLREKVLAAKRAGVERVLFPRENQRDLEELPEDVKDGLAFYPVSEMKQVLDLSMAEGGQVWK